MLRVLLIVISLLAFTSLRAQVPDSTGVRQDTVRKVPAKPATAAGQPVVKSAARLELEKMPRRAATRSAIIPGWGQVTNRRWWKVPLIYGGFVGIALVYDFNQTQYKLFLTEAQNREYNSQNPATPKPVDPAYATLSDNGIITIKDGYRRNRDLTILAGVAFYTINIIDAYVDAKFFRFDISDELVLKVNPSLQQQSNGFAYALPTPSIKVSVSLTK
ncbi:hypothetical protein GZH53_15980 [Flavihumibacter sp. R14]|nr:hypothetical protein [Flavihumibacter soli]